MQLCRYAAFFIALPSSPLSKLHFALNDATQWMSDYNGFNYEEFYEFVVDFFEEDQTPEGKAAASELLTWWNRYVAGSQPPFTVADTSPGACSRGPLLPERLPPHRQGGRRSPSYDDNAKHAHDAPSWFTRGFMFI